MKIEVRALSPALLGDYLDYFDHVAFSDNADWAGCYCYFYHADPELEEWDSRTGADNRASAAQLISRGQMHGYLAYVDGRVAGWCNAGPKTSYALLMQDEELTGGDVASPAGAAAAGSDLESIGSIVCFNVAPGRRRLGIATALLEAATAGLTGMGLTIAEAYPREGATNDAGHYHGPLEMYLRAGFHVHRRLDGCVVVRKNLIPAAVRLT